MFVIILLANMPILAIANPKYMDGNFAEAPSLLLKDR